MKSKWIMIVTALVLVCLVSQPIFAQPAAGAARGARGTGAAATRGTRGAGAGMMAGLELTKEQQEKMAKIREEYGSKIQDASPEERREIYTKMREAINAVLTPEQREQMRTRMGAGRGERPERTGRTEGMGSMMGRGFGRNMDKLNYYEMSSRSLELKEEQTKKIAAIREEALKKIMAVLTEEQRKQVTEAMKQMEERFKQMMERGGPGGFGAPGGREGDRGTRGGQGGAEGTRGGQGGAEGGRGARGGRGGRGQ